MNSRGYFEGKLSSISSHRETTQSNVLRQVVERTYTSKKKKREKNCVVCAKKPLNKNDSFPTHVLCTLPFTQTKRPRCQLFQKETEMHPCCSPRQRAQDGSCLMRGPSTRGSTFKGMASSRRPRSRCCRRTKSAFSKWRKQTRGLCGRLRS